MSRKSFKQRCVALLAVFVMIISCLGFQAPKTDAYAATTGMSVVCGKRTIAVKCTTTIKTSVPATFKSSDTSVALVNSKGLVVGRKAGVSKITITAKNNKKIKRIVTITVKNQLAAKTPASGKMTLYIGHSSTIKTNLPATFKSMNTMVATVDRTGKVVAKKAGSVKIKMTAKSNPKLTAMVTVTVKTPLIVTSPKSSRVAIKLGESVTIRTNIPADFDLDCNGAVGIKTINQMACVVEPLNIGVYIVKVKAKNNPKLVKKIRIIVSGKKDANDVAALKKIIKDLNSQGMQFPENLENECYKWKKMNNDSDALCRLVAIDWPNMENEYNTKAYPHVLNIDGLEYLESLDVRNNNLTGLNITNCDNLKYLDCSNNNLQNLNVSNLKNLIDLYCSDNRLTKLDATVLPKIETLYCCNNNLTSLDVRNLKKLSQLDCSNNKLASLDVSSLTKLRVLDCSKNRIKKLDVSKCACLRDLNYGDNVMVIGWN